MQFDSRAHYSIAWPCIHFSDWSTSLESHYQALSKHGAAGTEYSWVVGSHLPVSQKDELGWAGLDGLQQLLRQSLLYGNSQRTISLFP